MSGLEPLAPERNRNKYKGLKLSNNTLQPFLVPDRTSSPAKKKGLFSFLFKNTPNVPKRTVGTAPGRKGIKFEECYIDEKKLKEDLESEIKKSDEYFDKLIKQIKDEADEKISDLDNKKEEEKKEALKKYDNVLEEYDNCIEKKEKNEKNNAKRHNNMEKIRKKKEENNTRRRKMNEKLVSANDHFQTRRQKQSQGMPRAV